MNGVKRVTIRRSAEEWRAIVSRFERGARLVTLDKSIPFAAARRAGTESLVVI